MKTEKLERHAYREIEIGEPNFPATGIDLIDNKVGEAVLEDASEGGAIRKIEFNAHILLRNHPCLDGAGTHISIETLYRQ